MFTRNPKAMPRKVKSKFDVKDESKFRPHLIIILLLALTQTCCGPSLRTGKITIEDFSKKPSRFLFSGSSVTGISSHPGRSITCASLKGVIRFISKDKKTTMLFHPFTYRLGTSYGYPPPSGAELLFFNEKGVLIEPPGVTMEGACCIEAKITQDRFALGGAITREEIEQNFGPPLLTFFSDKCIGGEVLLYLKTSVSEAYPQWEKFSLWEGFLACVDSTGKTLGILKLKSIWDQEESSPQWNEDLNIPWQIPTPIKSSRGQIFRDKNPIIVIETNYGTIELELYWKESPITSENFLELVNSGFYNNLTFHRIVRNFVIQGGDPSGDGTGGPGYAIPDEPTSKTHIRGAVGMAKVGPNTAGSQFYICLRDTPYLDKGYTVFAQVVSGMDMVDKIGKAKIDSMNRPIEKIVIKSVYEEKDQR